MHSLKYGSGIVTLQATGANQITKQKPPVATPIGNLGQAFVDAASAGCVGSSGLNTMVSPGDLYTIVLPGEPVPGHAAQILPFLTYYLTSLGVPEKNIALLISQSENAPSEAGSLIPQSLTRTFQTVVHSCDGKGLVSLGETARKTPVFVHPLLTGRKVILLGTTHPDPILGFCGGPTSLLGACARKTIEACYRQAFVPGKASLSPKTASCSLTGNPVHEDLLEIVAKINPLFSINLLTDSTGHLLRILCGRWTESWYQSCREFQRDLGSPLSAPADIVVASCGGYPRDASLQAACISLVHACQSSKNDGTVLLAAECRDGGGSDPNLNDLDALREESLVQRLLAAPTAHGMRFLVALRLLQTRRVLMQTKLSSKNLPQIHMEAFRTMETMEAKVHFSGKSVLLLPDAAGFYPYYC